MNKRTATPARRSAAAAQLIETLGLGAEGEGLPRGAGRLFAYLLLREEPVTFDRIARDLGMSRGAVSMNTRLLEARGVLERVRRPGERKVLYQLTEDPFDHIVTSRLARRRRTREAVAQALASLPPGRTSLRRRLEEMRRFYDILITRLESVVTDWRTGRRPRPRTPRRKTIP